MSPQCDKYQRNHLEVNQQSHTSTHRRRQKRQKKTSGVNRNDQPTWLLKFLSTNVFVRFDRNTKVFGVDRYPQTGNYTSQPSLIKDSRLSMSSIYFHFSIECDTAAFTLFWTSFKALNGAKYTCKLNLAKIQTVKLNTQFDNIFISAPCTTGFFVLNVIEVVTITVTRGKLTEEPTQINELNWW